MQQKCDDFVRQFQVHSKPKVLLDVRGNEETTLGTLPGAVKIPLPELEVRIAEIAKGSSVFVYCASGGRAAQAAAKLSSHGFEVVFHANQGGYKELKSLWNPPATSLHFEQLFDEATSTFTYIIADKETRDAAIVDSVREHAESYASTVEERGYRLKYLIETHIHADHITANAWLRAKFPEATIALHGDAGVTGSILPLKEGSRLSVGKIEILVLATPGHTKESLSFLVNNEKLLTGDTLFIDSCGRTDFQAGDTRAMYESLKKLTKLGPDTLVYPAHDYKGRRVSSIAEQLTTNKLLSLSWEAFESELQSWNLPPPKRLQESVTANLKCGEVC